MSIPYRVPLTMSVTKSKVFCKGATVVALYKQMYEGRVRYRCCLPYADVNSIPMRYDSGYVNRAALQTRIWLYEDELYPYNLKCQCGNKDKDTILTDEHGVGECLICGSIIIHGKCIPNKIEEVKTTKKKPTISMVFEELVEPPHHTGVFSTSELSDVSTWS